FFLAGLRLLGTFYESFVFRLIEFLNEITPPINFQCGQMLRRKVLNNLWANLVIVHFLGIASSHTYFVPYPTYLLYVPTILGDKFLDILKLYDIHHVNFLTD